MGNRPVLPHPLVVSLSQPESTDPRLTGAKAANLAAAGRAGLPVLPGAVLTTAAAPGRLGHPAAPEHTPEAADHALNQVWRRLSDGGRRAVVVRSSSIDEDGSGSSMAGVFTSVLDVVGWPALVSAVAEVRASAHDDGAATMAVLVQPQLSPRWGGVLFGADPVSGRTDRLAVSAVEGGPDRLVSGLDDGWNAVLTPRGRVSEVRSTGGGPPPPRPVLRRLAALARRAGDTFGGPQDIEWAVDHDGRLWLLQSRPITSPTGAAAGPVLGTGPVAETFPDPLAPLERDLWLPPLAEGIAQALRLTGTASSRAIARSPVVTAVDGWAVADLDLLGVVGADELPYLRRVLHRFDPRPPARRLRAAWRVGRLGRALPGLARDLIAQVDEHLAAVGDLHGLHDDDLLAVVDAAHPTLRALHGYEALAGMLVPAATSGVTAASLALEVLADDPGGARDLEQIVAEEPVLLALVPPRIGPPDLELLAAFRQAQPGTPDGSGDIGDGAEPDDAALVREGLRLRVRWVHELVARATWELAGRLEAGGVLPHRHQVRLLGAAELRAAVRHRALPFDLAERIEGSLDEARPVPARFRLTEDGRAVAVATRKGAEDAALGAGGGAGQGPVHLGTEPPAGAVLVVKHLDPRLAPAIPRLGGLVAETGSPLSHLAILAREHGVPVVVGMADATGRFGEGDLVSLDGATGTVVLDAPAGQAPADATANGDGGSVIDLRPVERPGVRSPGGRSGDGEAAGDRAAGAEGAAAGERHPHRIGAQR